MYADKDRGLYQEIIRPKPIHVGLIFHIKSSQGPNKSVTFYLSINLNVFSKGHWQLGTARYDPIYGLHVLPTLNVIVKYKFQKKLPAYLWCRVWATFTDCLKKM